MIETAETATAEELLAQVDEGLVTREEALARFEESDPADQTEDELVGVPAPDPTPTPTDLFIRNYLAISYYLKGAVGKQTVKDETALRVMEQAAGAASLFTQIELANEK